MACRRRGRRRASSASAASRRSPLFGKVKAVGSGTAQAARPAAAARRIRGSAGPPRWRGSFGSLGGRGRLGCPLRPCTRAAAAQSYRRGRRDSPRNLRISALAGGGRSDRDPAAPARCCAGCIAGRARCLGLVAQRLAGHLRGRAGIAARRLGRSRACVLGRILGCSRALGRGILARCLLALRLGGSALPAAGWLPLARAHSAARGLWGCGRSGPAGPACAAVRGFPLTRGLLRRLRGAHYQQGDGGGDGAVHRSGFVQLFP